jgi:hypothetical protein
VISGAVRPDVIMRSDKYMESRMASNRSLLLVDGG